MKKSAFISDVLFYGLLVGIFTLCLFRFLRLRLFLSVVLGGVCGILAACASASLLMHKRKNYFLKRSEEGKKERLLEHLCLLSDEKKTQLLCSVFSKSTQSSIKKSGKLRMIGEDTFYFLHLKFTPVTADEVASAARWKTGKQKVLVCNLIDEYALALGEKLGLQFCLGEDIYQATKTANALPSEFLGDVEKTPRRRFRLWLSKRNAKGFFTGGLLLLLSSLFSPFPYYYLVFGGGLFLLAFFVKIFGYL